MRDIHSQPTKLLVGQRSLTCRRERGADRRITWMSDHRSCRSCTAWLARDAMFCWMCGDRARAGTSLIGHVIDEVYEVLELVAEGHTATIYRARYLPSGLDVALKVLRAELTYDAIAVARFRREGRCLARLRDPHTVALYDHGEAADGTSYLAMELLCGEGLDVRVRTRGAMPWRSALSIIRGVCRALSEAHAHGIVHRALTPAHVRLGSGETVKVIDFGLAKLRPNDDDEDLAVAGEAVGSLQYMAPELISGHTCDARADVYAIGAIWLELLLGRVRRPDMAPAVLPTEVPLEVEKLIQRCLVADPSGRISTAREVGAQIDRILATQTANAPSRRPSQRRPMLRTAPFVFPSSRIILDVAPVPGPPIAAAPPARTRWKWWAAALVASVIGLGTAAAGCV